ncbi:MAG TPA: diacylglycerol kinase family protein [Devosia sp.]|nr:diacylglycerol kinase family protein [Devosia sp.]
MRFIGVLNRDGGTFRQTDMDAFIAMARDIFAAAGHELEARAVDGPDLRAELERAAADRGDVVLAGGGDGTISTAAAVCFAAGKPLAVLPAGTRNLFARTLRVPMNLEQALRDIAGGKLYAVDIATANGKPFVHQYSVGVHARLVRIREELDYNNRWQKMLASLRSFSGTLAKPLRFKVDILAPTGTQQRIASGISVSNNVLAEGHVPYSDDIDGGVLGVYLVKPMSRWDLFKLLVGVMLGRWKAHPRVSENSVTSVTLMFPHRKRSAKAVIDGELVALPAKVELQVHPGALKVFAPLALEEAVTSSETGPAPATEQGPG